MIPYESIPNDHIFRLGAIGAHIKHLETFISDDEYTVRFSEIFMFATGMETFPPLGFTLLLNMVVLHYLIIVCYEYLHTF